MKLTAERRQRWMDVIAGTPAEKIGSSSSFIRGVPNCAIGHLMSSEGIREQEENEANSYAGMFHLDDAYMAGVRNIYRANDHTLDPDERKEAVLAAIAALPVES